MHEDDIIAEAIEPEVCNVLYSTNLQVVCGSSVAS